MSGKGSAPSNIETSLLSALPLMIHNPRGRGVHSLIWPIRRRAGGQDMKYQEISFYYLLCDLLCNHNNGDLFTCEDNILFSRVNISFFRAKAHLVFHWCLYNKQLSSNIIFLSRHRAYYIQF